MTNEFKYSTTTDDALFAMFEELTALAEASDAETDWNAVAEVEEEIARRQSQTGTLFV